MGGSATGSVNPFVMLPGEAGGHAYASIPRAGSIFGKVSPGASQSMASGSAPSVASSSARCGTARPTWSSRSSRTKSRPAWRGMGATMRAMDQIEVDCRFRVVHPAEVTGHRPGAG